MSKPKQRQTIRRDLAIEAACNAIIRMIDPHIGNCGIRERGELLIHDNGYTATLDGKPFAVVRLEGTDAFTMTLIR